MVSVTQQDDNIRFTVHGLHKIWAFKGSLTFPRAHIIGARLDPMAARNLKGFRALGTSVPGLIAAGTFYLNQHLKPSFFDVVNRKRTVVVTLRDEAYQQLIIEVADPAAVVALLGSSDGTPS